MDDSEPLNTITSIRDKNNDVLYQSEHSEDGTFCGQELTDFGFVETNVETDRKRPINPSESILSIDSLYSGDDSDSSTHSSSSFQNVIDSAHSPQSSSLSKMTDGTISKPLQKNQQQPINLLGKQYNSTYNSSFQLDQGSLFWFTYRRDFPELMPYKLTSDAGWGCMLRASQMLLAQALRLHYMGRMWRPSSIKKNPKNIHVHDQMPKHDSFTTFIANAFADYPGPSFPFSLPNMVATGLRYDKLPGEWYGPGTAAHVLRDLMLIYQKQQGQFYDDNHNKLRSSKEFNRSQDAFKIMVVQEGCMYKDSVEEFMTQEGLISTPPTSSEPPPRHHTPILLHPLEAPSFPKLAKKEKKMAPSNPSLQWDSALLLLIPLRLGLQKFNTDYSEALADVFSLPQSVGMLGGSPRHAIWYYGSVRTGQNDMNRKGNDDKEYKLFGLDPHTVQATPSLQSCKNKQSNLKDHQRKKIVMSDKTMSSLHPSSYFNPNNTHSSKPVCMSIKNIDPSLALAFYCRDREDFENLVQSLSPSQSNNIASCSKPDYYNLFSIMDTKPDYNAHMSLLVEDDYDDSDDELQVNVGDASGERKTGRDNEEDEYIFL